MNDTFKNVLSSATETLGFQDGYEDQLLQRLPEVLFRARRFIDIGANRGLFSYIANSCMTNGEIVAVEANPQLADTLNRNFSMWPADRGNTLTTVACGVGDHASSLPFTMGTEDTLGSFSISDYRRADVVVIDISVRPLDEITPPKPGTVLKIDIEGFEYRALVGATRHLAQLDCKILIELHSWGDATNRKFPHHVLGLLRRRGFRVQRFGEPHQFYCEHAGIWARWSSYLAQAPRFYAKYLLRKAGLRDIVRNALGRSLESGLRN